MVVLGGVAQPHTAQPAGRGDRIGDRLMPAHGTPLPFAARSRQLSSTIAAVGRLLLMAAGINNARRLGPSGYGPDAIPTRLAQRSSPMTIIDCQVHAYEANTPKRPWHSVPNWPDHVTGDEMVAAMDKVGVDGAIFISAFSMYRYDASYAVEVQRAHPGRFAIVKPVDPDDPAVADVVADWKNTPGTVGIRIILTKEAKREPNDPGLDWILGAAVRHDFPVNICAGATWTRALR